MQCDSDYGRRSKHQPNEPRKYVALERLRPDEFNHYENEARASVRGLMRQIMQLEPSKAWESICYDQDGNKSTGRQPSDSEAHRGKFTGCSVPLGVWQPSALRYALLETRDKDPPRATPSLILMGQST